MVAEGFDVFIDAILMKVATLRGYTLRILS